MSLISGNKANIYTSRERIRSELSDLIKEYSDLEDVDLSKSSFVSYIIDVLSALSSNQLFYSSSIYREFFLTQAKFPDSVYNLANWIGYQPRNAIPATVSVLFSFPTNFMNSDQAQIIIPENYQVWAGDTPFTISVGNTDMLIKNSDETNLYPVTIQIIENTSATIKDSLGNTYPVQYNPENKDIQFILPFEQTDFSFESFMIPEDLEIYQFFDKEINFNGMYYDIDVYVLEDTEGEELPSTYEEFENLLTKSEYSKWIRSQEGIHTLGESDPYYVWRPKTNKGTLLFGNGIIGRQPKAGSYVCVVMKTTKGYDGTIIANQIKNFQPLYYKQPGGEVRKLDFTVTNPIPSTKGQDEPTLPEVKSQAISNLRSREKFVSSDDFDDFNLISPDVPLINSKPILKRSDLKINEIVMFASLLFHNLDNEPELVPTKNMKIGIPDFSFIPSKSDISDKETNETFRTLFNIVPDSKTLTADYEYIIDEVDIGLESNEQLSKADRKATISCNTATFRTIEDIDIVSHYWLQVDINTNTLKNETMTIEDLGDNRQYYLSVITNWDSVEYPFDETNNVTIERVPPNTGQVVNFRFSLDSISKVPHGPVQFFFDIYGYFSTDELQEIFNPQTEQQLNSLSNIQPLRRYVATLTIREKLNNMMLSQISPNFSIYGNNLYSNKIYEDPNNNKWKILSADQTEESESELVSKIIPYDTTSNPEVGLWTEKYYDETLDSWISDSTTTIETIETEDYNDLFDTTSIVPYVIHDVPVVLSDYFEVGSNEDAIEQRNRQFENSVIQNLINNFNVEEKRMATDFINVKTADTAGKLTNLNYNSPDRIVEQRSIPEDYQVGKQYIVNGNENIIPTDSTSELELINKRHYIARISLTGEFIFIKPSEDDIVYVKNEDKKYIFTGKMWKIPEFNIPLEVEAEIQKDQNIAITNSALITNIKDELLKQFPHDFDKNIDKSELIKTIRSVDGVLYCNLIKPEVNLKFKYSVDDLTKKQLTDYTPQLVAITYDSITIKVNT